MIQQNLGASTVLLKYGMLIQCVEAIVRVHLPSLYSIEWETVRTSSPVMVLWPSPPPLRNC